MFMTVDYVREMTVKKPCMANMDRLSICSSCYHYCYLLLLSQRREGEQGNVEVCVEREQDGVEKPAPTFTHCVFLADLTPQQHEQRI